MTARLPTARSSRAQNPAAFPEAATAWLARKYPSAALGGLLSQVRLAAMWGGDRRRLERGLRRHQDGIVNALRRLQPHLEGFVELWGDDAEARDLWKASRALLERLGTTDRKQTPPRRPRSRGPRIIEAARRYATMHGLPVPGNTATFLLAVAVGAEPPCPTVDAFHRRLDAWSKDARTGPRGRR